MSPNVPQSDKSSHAAGAAQREAIREQFVAQWLAGTPPRIEAFLSADESGESGRLLEDLLRIEFAQRRLRGDVLTEAEYAARFPGQRTLIARLLNEVAAVGSDQETRMLDDVPAGLSGNVAASAQFSDLEFVAEGGLGEVFSAREEKLNRRVALKFIHGRHTGRKDIYERFLFEAEVASRLDHPGVVPVYAMGQGPDGRPFYAMRFIRGEKLTVRIAAYHNPRRTDVDRRAHRLELRTLLRHLVSAANTLAYAHHRGVAHLDVKPDNIMIGGYGETLVVDWGLAIPLDEASRYELSYVPDEQTRFVDTGDSPSGTGAGTLPYMSPEQCDATWGPVGPASDIYALGVTLYYVLTGRLPFSGRDFERDYRDPKREGRFQHPTAVTRSVPAALEAICLKAMAARPEDRYFKASDFAADLERWLADEPVSVYDEPLAEKLVRSTRRHRNWAAAISAAVLAALGVTAAAAVMLAQAREQEYAERVAAEEATTVAEDAKLRADAARIAALRMAARFAAATVAREVDLRLRIVEGKAHDARLRELMQVAPGELRSSPARKELQAWLEKCKRDTQRATKAESWYINDADGVQIARADLETSTIDKSFWYRDYFHGRGLDLPDSADRDDISPVRTAYLANIYRSKSTGWLKVAFVYPIWADDAAEEEGREPLGILGMSVDVGEFRALESGLDQRHPATLVSLRPDVVEGTEATGMILHHPKLAARLQSQLARADSVRALPRIEPELEKRLESLRERGWELLQLNPDANVELEGSLDTAYHDVLSDDPQARHLAIFEPVFIPWRTEPNVQDPGWVVIVQETDDDLGTTEATGKPKE